jgi:outer membrane protein assembly factor BamB
VLVYGSYVLVASTDRHIYAFDRIGGNQIWRFDVGGVINQPPALQDNIYYFVDDQNRATAIPLGNQAFFWQRPLEIPNISPTATAVTGFVVAGNMLFVGVAHEGQYYILQLDRNQGGVLRPFNIGAVAPLALTVGYQLLYVAGNGLWALDIHDFELVWVRTDLTEIRTPPVYAAEGASAVAELYIGLSNGNVRALDANTGVDVHSYNGEGEVVTALALGDNALYATGNAFVKAFDRRSNNRLWRASINGEASGGAIVTDNSLIVVTKNGAIQFIDPDSGYISASTGISTPVFRAPALSGTYLYVPGNDRRVYGFIQ